MNLYSVPGHETALERLAPKRWRLRCATCKRTWSGPTWALTKKAHVDDVARERGRGSE